MSGDLVRKLREARYVAFDECGDYDLAQEAATALTEARAEIERRDAFIKELSDALRSIRPLGGSELFVKRFGNYYADPVYCKAAIEKCTEEYHNAMKAHVRARKQADAAESELSTLRARAEKAESALAEAVEVLMPFADEAAKYDPDEGDSHEHAWGRLDLTIGHLRAARRFIASQEPAEQEK